MKKLLLLLLLVGIPFAKAECQMIMPELDPECPLTKTNTIFGDEDSWRNARFQPGQNPYTITNEGVFYRYRPFSKSIPVAADPKTFEFLCGDYGKDKDRIYFRGGGTGADPQSFGVFKQERSCWITKDKNWVYFGGNPILGADPHSFKLFIDPKDYLAQYATDRHRIYYGPHLTPTAGGIRDLEHFESLGKGYFRDRNHFYYHYNQKPILSGKYIFQYLGGGYVLIGDNIYYHGQPLKDFKLDQATFKGLGDDEDDVYVVDKNGVYLTSGPHGEHKIQKIAFADLDSFRSIDTITPFQDARANEMGYAVDKNFFYYLSSREVNKSYPRTLQRKNLPPGLDHESLTILGSQYLRDKNQVYMICEEAGCDTLQILKRADPKTFQALRRLTYTEPGYGKDQYHVYWGKEIIDGADPATFELKETDDPAVSFFQDKQYIYEQGKPRIPNIPLEAFRKRIEGSWKIDKTSYKSLEPYYQWLWYPLYIEPFTFSKESDGISWHTKENLPIITIYGYNISSLRVPIKQYQCPSRTGLQLTHWRVEFIGENELKLFSGDLPEGVLLKRATKSMPWFQWISDWFQ